MNLDDLTIRDIALITKLPATTSLRVLASTLGVEPSNLSRAVKTLEDRLGVRLLSRSSLGVTATAEARILAKKAAVIYEAVRDLPIKGSTAKRPFERFINIGSRGFVNTYAAPKLVQGFSEAGEQDELGLRFFDLSPDEAQAAARLAVIDALICFEDAPLGRSWQQYTVGKLAWRLYARPRNPIVTAGPKVDLASLRVGHHCAFDGKAQVLSDGLLFSSLGIRQVGHGAQSAYTALAIAAASDHLACVPEVVAESLVADRKIVEIPLPDVAISTPVYLFIHSERVQQKELKTMKKAVESMF